MPQRRLDRFTSARAQLLHEACAVGALNPSVTLLHDDNKDADCALVLGDLYRPDELDRNITLAERLGVPRLVLVDAGGWKGMLPVPPQWRDSAVFAHLLRHSTRIRIWQEPSAPPAGYGGVARNLCGRAPSEMWLVFLAEHDARVRDLFKLCALRAETARIMSVMHSADGTKLVRRLEHHEMPSVVINGGSADA